MNVSHCWGKLLKVTKGRGWRRHPELKLRISTTGPEGEPELMTVSLRGEFAERMAMVLEPKMVVSLTGCLSNAAKGSFNLQVVGMKVLSLRLPTRELSQALKKMQLANLPSQPRKRKRIA